MQTAKGLLTRFISTIVSLWILQYNVLRTCFILLNSVVSLSLPGCLLDSIRLMLLFFLEFRFGRHLYLSFFSPCLVITLINSSQDIDLFFISFPNLILWWKSVKYTDDSRFIIHPINQLIMMIMIAASVFKHSNYMRTHPRNYQIRMELY